MQVGGTGRALNSSRKEYQIIKYYPWPRNLLNVVKTLIKFLSFLEMGEFIDCLRDFVFRILLYFRFIHYE